MKRAILLFFSLVLCHYLVYTQNVYAEFTFGAGIPLRPYSSAGALDVGNAKTGVQGNVNIGYRFNESIGIGLKGIFCFIYPRPQVK